MTGKDNRIEKLLAATSLRIHPHRFVLISLPSSNLTLFKQRLSDIEAAFWSATIEEDEMTLIAPAPAWNNISQYFPKAKTDDDYRVITLDAVTNWDIAGYLTQIMGLLAKEDVGCRIVSGFTKNHLIIRNRDLIRAIEVLNRAIETAQ